MHWSPQQDAALIAVSRFLNDPDQQVFYLAGYAGTGKTTLAKHLAEGVSGLVLFMAYTGKAAYVLRKKGCSNATTMHSHMYVPKDKSKERLRELEAALAQVWERVRAQTSGDVNISNHPDVVKAKAAVEEEKKNLARPIFSLNTESAIKQAALCVVDECSMVGQRMGEDLLSYGRKVLVLGDPAQLPPIAEGGYFTSREPDFLLTDIHRQARDNPIIELARIVREGGRLSVGNYGSSRVLDRRAVSPELVLAADQILVGKNATRRAINHRMRSLLGRDTSQYPTEGDKLVCLRNNHEIGLLNGAIWNTLNSYDNGEFLDLVIKQDPEDGDLELGVQAWKNHFHRDFQAVPWWDRAEAEEFDYGYALTVHKAQGSQWNNVLLFDEWYNRDTRQQWLYTAITRAAETVTIVQM